MAWTEKLPGGKHRGCWRDPSGHQHHTKRPDFPEHPYSRKRDALEAAQEAEVKARRQAAAQKGTISGSVTWSEWWEYLALDYPLSDSGGTVTNAVKNYIKPKWGDVPLIGIEQRDVKAWIADLTPNRAASYVRRIYGVFHRSISIAVDRGTLTASPCAGVKLPSVRRRPKVYSDEEYLASLAPSIPKHYRDLNDVGLDTGLRPGELCGMHADQLDLDGGWVEVTTVLVSRRRLIRHYPKDEDARNVPLTEGAIRVLRAQLDGRDLTGGCGVPHADGKPCKSALVFRNAQRNEITPEAWREAHSAASRKLGVRTRSPYSVRRGFATRAARGGIDAFELAEIMGHADVRQTRDYVQQTPAARDRLRAALGEPTRLTVVQGQSGADAGAEPHRTPLDDTGIEGRENRA